MKLVSTEIDGVTIQLSYTDGPPVDEANELLVLRVPAEKSLNRSLNWHQFQALKRIHAWIDGEMNRIDTAMRDGQ